MPQGWDLGVPWGVEGSKNFFSQIQPDLVCELLVCVGGDLLNRLMDFDQSCVYSLLGGGRVY